MLVGLAVIGYSRGTLANNDELVIALGGGSPYIIVEGKQIREKNPGISVEIINAVAKKLDWRITYEVMPFSRQLAVTSQGKADALMAILKTDAPDYVFPSEPVGVASNCLFSEKELTFYFPERQESLDHYRVGVSNGFTYGLMDDYIAENRSKNIIALAGEDDEVIQRLLMLLNEGRIDAFIEAESVVNYHLKKNNLPPLLKVVCTPILEVFLAFSPNRPDSRARVQAFDKALKELRSIGRVATILAKYNVTNWQ